MQPGHVYPGGHARLQRLVEALAGLLRQVGGHVLEAVEHDHVAAEALRDGEQRRRLGGEVERRRAPPDGEALVERLPVGRGDHAPKGPERLGGAVGCDVQDPALAGVDR